MQNTDGVSVGLNYLLAATLEKHSSAALGGGLGAWIGGPPGAAVGGAIGAKEHHRGHAALSAGLGSLGGGLAGAVTLGGLTALLTHRRGGLETRFNPWRGRYGRHELHWRASGSNPEATALASLLGLGAGSIAGGAIGGRHSDTKHGK